MKLSYTPLTLIVIVLTFSCQQMSTTDKEKIENEIFTILENQVRYWNEGDIERYMDGYHRSDSLRFASDGTISYGWHKTLEHYKKGYPDKSSMGALQFTDIDVTVISSDAALVFGRWELQKENDNPWGLFTLLFQKTKDGWRIVHDHTSSAKE